MARRRAMPARRDGCGERRVAIAELGRDGRRNRGAGALPVTTAASFVPTGACWVCGATGQRPVHTNCFELSVYAEQDPELTAYTGASVTLAKCPRCGFMQPEELPALPRFFDRLYDQRWSRAWVVAEFESRQKRAIFERLLRSLERRIPQRPRRLLDVGAHVGRFIAMARDRGWDAEGLELNPTTAAYARERTHAVIHQRPLRAVATDTRPFDAVTLTDVLEHMPRPVDVLRDAATALRSGGWVAVKVPCGRNQLMKERVRAALGRAARVSIADNLVHVTHFSPRALRCALERAGFDRVSIDVGVPERNETGSALGRAGSNIGRRMIYQVARACPWGVHTPLAFNLQAFARRP